MEANSSPVNRRNVNFAFDFDQPALELYNPETVDFPSSPSGLKNRPKETMEPEALPEAPELPGNEDTEYAGSDADEYFEDYVSPLTYENSLSTRRSFIRKVKSAAVEVPDAERIEGIVRSGHLKRHGSIRRKIVPLLQDLNTSSDSANESGLLNIPAQKPSTSTPLADRTGHQLVLSSSLSEASRINSADADLEKSLGELGSLEEDTILKIRDCLDAEKIKDVYTLGSRLQDLLSPTEIEEILNNTKKYTDVFGEDLVLALSGSINDSQLSLQTPKKLLTAPKFDFENITSESSSQTITRPDLIRDDYSPRNDDKASNAKKRISAYEENPLHQLPESTSATPSEVWEGVVTDGLVTPGDVDPSIMERMPKPDLIPEVSADEEHREERNWKSVVISGLEKKIDMKVIEPYKKVLSHGGYEGKGCQTAIIVFSACYLPDRSRNDYDYVMENLFLYVLTTLEQLVAEDYVLVYFHGATPKTCMPRFSWLKKSYQMVDRRLRKNLKKLYLVHPTLWLKAFVLMCKPFISAKFTRKLKYIANLAALSSELPLDDICVPDRVKQ